MDFLITQRQTAVPKSDDESKMREERDADDRGRWSIAKDAFVLYQESCKHVGDLLSDAARPYHSTEKARELYEKGMDQATEAEGLRLHIYNTITAAEASSSELPLTVIYDQRLHCEMSCTADTCCHNMSHSFRVEKESCLMIVISKIFFRRDIDRIQLTGPDSTTVDVSQTGGTQNRIIYSGIVRPAADEYKVSWRFANDNDGRSNTESAKLPRFLICLFDDNVFENYKKKSEIELNTGRLLAYNKYVQRIERSKLDIAKYDLASLFHISEPEVTSRILWDPTVLNKLLWELPHHVAMKRYQHLMEPVQEHIHHIGGIQDIISGYLTTPLPKSLKERNMPLSLKIRAGNYPWRRSTNLVYLHSDGQCVFVETVLRMQKGGQMYRKIYCTGTFAISKAVYDTEDRSDVEKGKEYDFCKLAAQQRYDVTLHMITAGTSVENRRHRNSKSRRHGEFEDVGKEMFYEFSIPCDTLDNAVEAATSNAFFRPEPSLNREEKGLHVVKLVIGTVEFVHIDEVPTFSPPPFHFDQQILFDTRKDYLPVSVLGGSEFVVQDFGVRGRSKSMDRQFPYY